MNLKNEMTLGQILEEIEKFKEWIKFIRLTSGMNLIRKSNWIIIWRLYKVNLGKEEIELFVTNSNNDRTDVLEDPIYPQRFIISNLIFEIWESNMFYEKRKEYQYI